MTQDSLRDVIGLRAQLAREALDLAEKHRDEVWARLRSRISGLEDGPDSDLEMGYGTPSEQRWEGPERRRSPAEPMYAGDAPLLKRRLNWARLGKAHIAGAVLVGAAVAAAITFS